MALIAFCAIALVENVTNAHPAGGEDRGRVGVEVGGETREKQNKTKGLDRLL